jgi:hypothetical protein
MKYLMALIERWQTGKITVEIDGDLICLKAIY